MANGTHTLEVWGDFACFTRPEMKVERFSYLVITPSAARGIELSAIKPKLIWRARRLSIESLKSPIKFFSRQRVRVNATA